MKNFLQLCFIFFLVLISFVASAEEEIKLTIKNNGDVVFYRNVPLPGEGMLDINDSGGNPHTVNARSVLFIINEADIASSDFNISNLIYYPSFGAFYLKCITIYVGTELCDNWQYKINNDYPSVGMDQTILSGGENIILYFGKEELPPSSSITYSPSGSHPAPESAVSTQGVTPVEEVIVAVPIPTPLISPPNIESTKTEEMKIEIKTEEVKKLANNEIPRSVVKKNQKKNLEKKELPNQASVITVVDSGTGKEQIPQTVKHSWFMRFLSKIFSF